MCGRTPVLTSPPALGVVGRNIAVVLGYSVDSSSVLSESKSLESREVLCRREVCLVRDQEERGMYWLAKEEKVQLRIAQPRGGAYKKRMDELVLLKTQCQVGHGW